MSKRQNTRSEVLKTFPITSSMFKGSIREEDRCDTPRPYQQEQKSHLKGSCLNAIIPESQLAMETAFILDAKCDVSCHSHYLAFVLLLRF